MSNKDILKEWIIETLKVKNGQASVLEVCKYVWLNHEHELRASDDLFYTWQYDIRWAATDLRREGKLLSAKKSPRGVWQLNGYITNKR